MIVEAVVSGPVLMVEVRPLVVMLDVVAQRRGMNRSENDAWIEAIRVKLADVGVVSVRAFVMNVVVLNKKLKACGHRELHERTLNQLLAEACEMVMGPEEEDEDAAVM